MKEKKMIYLDNAATTALSGAALDSMLPYLKERFGNASTVYRFGQAAKQAVEQSRRILAGLLGVSPMEILFTSGGTESDNWAILGAAEMAGNGHIITTKIEHHAVLSTCEYLESKGYSVTYLNVDKEGRVDVRELENAIRPDTFLISIMTANNEIGTIQPIEEIGRIAREHGILFHTDAVQAFGHISIDIQRCKIDMLSVSAHKLYGPKGVGMLYLRRGVRLPSFLHGGAQEKGHRAGTENVPGIVGFGKAAELAYKSMAESAEKEQELRDYLIERMEREIPGIFLNGHREERLPNNVNFCIQNVDGESLLLHLDGKDICASSGSACASGSLEPSHVLLALGRSPEDARGGLRLSLSAENSREELDYVVDSLKEIVDKLRKRRG